MKQGSLYTSAQAREFDRLATAAFAIPSYQLMQRAGAAATQYLLQHWPLAERIAVFAGPGNNGGDGYVLALKLRQAGRDVRLYALDGQPPRRGDAVLAAQEWQQAGGVIELASTAQGPFEVLVDALFGIGLTRALDPIAQACVNWINAQGVPVLALDVPSGIDADTGAVRGAAVRASVTMSFIVPKLGLHTGAASAHCGQLLCAELDLPAELTARAVAPAQLLSCADLRLPRRARNAHKGSHGHLLVIGSDHGYGGAVRLSGEAALRSGAGLVSIATRPEHASAILSARPELMVRAVASAAELEPLLERATVLAIGPGLGQGEWGRALFECALASGKPMVIDADALNLLAAAPRLLHPAVVLTPHPKEAARLLRVEVAQIEDDRPAAVKRLAERYGCVVVLKGAGSLIQAADGACRICPFGNPGMATAGMGDVLTGIIAALLAQQLGVFDAACLGVLAHALSGDAAAQVGERGLLASDLFGHLPRLLNTNPDAH